MSIASYPTSDSAIAAQVGNQPANVKKPPPKRLVVAIADTTQTPEPR
jgi:hypothetical protein